MNYRVALILYRLLYIIRSGLFEDKYRSFVVLQMFHAVPLGRRITLVCNLPSDTNVLVKESEKEKISATGIALIAEISKFGSISYSYPEFWNS